MKEEQRKSKTVLLFIKKKGIEEDIVES